MLNVQVADIDYGTKRVMVPNKNTDKPPRRLEVPSLEHTHLSRADNLAGYGRISSEALHSERKANANRLVEKQNAAFLVISFYHAKLARLMG